MHMAQDLTLKGRTQVHTEEDHMLKEEILLQMGIIPMLKETIP